MKLHSGKLIEVPVPNRQLKRSSSQSYGSSSVDGEPLIKQVCLKSWFCSNCLLLEIFCTFPDLCWLSAKKVRFSIYTLDVAKWRISVCFESLYQATLYAHAVILPREEFHKFQILRLIRCFCKVLEIGYDWFFFVCVKLQGMMSCVFHTCFIHKLIYSITGTT